jgi:hypothetical protein
MLCGVIGCAHPAGVGVRSGEVMQHLEALGRDGYAELDTVTIADAQVRAADREHVFLAQTVRFRGETTTLLKLVEGCAPFTASTPCLLIARDDEVIVLRTASRPAPAPAPSPTAVTPGTPRTAAQDAHAVTGVLSLTSFGGMTLCLILCESDRSAKSIALGGAGLVLGLIWLLTTGNARD